MPKKINRIGQRFNNLLIINYAASEKRKDGNGSFSRWECLCDCGNKTTVRTNNLVSNITKSCGCLCRQVPQRQPKGPKGQSGFLRVLRGYKISAKKRGYSFALSKSYFSKLTKQNCHYCGSPPKKVMSTGSDHSRYLYNGIDRVNNNIGYTKKNCVPCCDTCNKAKYIQTYSDFNVWTDSLVKYRLSKSKSS